MAIVARVARTAPDLKDLNRLRLGGFGVAALRLRLSDALSSATHLPAPFKPHDKHGDDKLHFAPVVEKPKILLRIDDPFGSVTAGKLELFRRGDTTAHWKRDLTEAELRDGEHQLEWDGTGLTVSPLFPDGCVTAQHSPYKLKLTLSSPQPSSKPLIAWTYFHVVLHEIELELGPRDVLAQPRDQALYDSLGGSLEAGAGAAKELLLTSNLFKTANARMYDNTGFEKLRDLWQTGPNLPVFAKLYVRDSAGAKSFSPRAVGGVRVLWDWEDVPETTTRHHEHAKKFLDAALDFDRKKTMPPGDNCHVSRGGKRGPGAAPVFPAQAGAAPAPRLAAGAFPFSVEACKRRASASLSVAWGSGLHEGKTGVLFQPSRIAGDAFRLKAYFAYDTDADGSAALDQTDAKPHAAPVHAAAPGVFQIWRRVDVPGYRKKLPSLGNFPMAVFQGYYERANVRMMFASPSPGPDLASDGYAARVATAVASQPFFVQAAVDETVDQGLTGFALQFRTFDDWKAALQAAQGWSPARLARWLINNPNFDTQAKYASACNDWAHPILTSACDAFVAAADGVNIFQFDGLQSQQGYADRVLNGFAPNLPACASGSKCGFIQCGPSTSYTGSSNRMEQTIAHEIGHHLFLPHAVDGVTPDGVPDATAHDQAFHNCTMSYQFDAERMFCGFCLLRLRGWDRTQLATSADRNRRK